MQCLPNGISRDPIGFRGLDWNKQRYVGNNPVTRLDPSGLRKLPLPGKLPPSCKPDAPGTKIRGCCGPAVDVQLSNLLAEVKKDFDGWDSYDTTLDHCEALYTPSTAQTAWDIEPLFWYSKADPGKDYVAVTPPCGLHPCEYSVTVGGQCHCANFVNYILFGFMNRLCYDFSLWWPYESIFVG